MKNTPGKFRAFHLFLMDFKQYALFSAGCLTELEDKQA